MDNLKIASRIEMWPIDRLIPYARNPRTHSREQILQLVDSMRENGLVNPVLVDRHGNVIAGHGRIWAAQQMRLTHVPVIVLDHLTETQAQALRIAANRISENGRWDEAILQADPLPCEMLVGDRTHVSRYRFDEASEKATYEK